MTDMAEFKMSESPNIGNRHPNQNRLKAIISGTHQTISVAEAASILKMPKRAVAKLMARWAEAGSLSRIKRGLYFTAPIKSSAVDSPPVEPWVIAEKLFQPCYIGGLTAAIHWELMENTNQTNMVMSIHNPRNRHQGIGDMKFLLRSISQESMFGLVSVWKGQCQVQISDPSRTMIDFLVDPDLGEGIHRVTDMFINYLNSEHSNIELLFEYAKRLRSGVVLKRLGFLLEQYEPCERATIALCKTLMSTGAVKLDPRLNADRLITRWGLWVPHDIEFHLSQNSMNMILENMVL